MATANRGKVAESKIQEALQKFADTHHYFDWHRVYDAHSAGGKFACQTGDFCWFFNGFNGALEVKEVAHDSRLPAKNFKPAQIARMRKRMLAGTQGHVIVRHSTSNKWRVIGLQFFLDDLEAKSWDLSAYPEFDSAWEVLSFMLNPYEIPGYRPAAAA